MPPQENETPAIHAQPSGQHPSLPDTPSGTGSSGGHTLEGVPTLQPDTAEPADTGDWSGLEIAGRYLVGDRLGQGGMGVVYLAEDRHLGDAAVIKRPHRHLVADTAAVERFLREVRSLISLRHPHICHVRDAGQHAGVPFVVMDYLAGGSLAERIAGFQPGCLPRDVLAWLPDIAKALDFVHRQGHVHRDVKPANILFDEHGNAYLGDLGIVKALTRENAAVQTPSLTRTGAFIGTPEYTAPEVFLGERHGERADQYALAAVVYELLCGQRPFDGPTPFAISVLQATTTPALPHEINTAIPEGISQALLQAMSREADRRFPSCRQFAQAINRGRKQTQEEHPEPLSVITNCIGMKMVLIPAGEFLMGAATNECGSDDEQPRHRVKLTRPFGIGRYPVTVREFRAFVEDTGYQTEAETGGGGYQWTGKEWKKNPDLDWRKPGFAQQDDHPVVLIGWNDVSAYCGWLTRKEGRMYRLPTEAEWEYACRSGTTTRFCFGDDPEQLDEYAWYIQNSKGTTHPVGQKKPNAWGLYDMHGNVWEWCADLWDENYYKQFADRVAVDPMGPSRGLGVVLRGGGWWDGAYRCRSACRDAGGNANCGGDQGFRLARSVS